MFDILWGALIGAAITLLIAAHTGVIDQHHKLKQECEKNLPRSQVCVMKLVPQGE